MVWTPLKNMKVNWDDEIPNINGKIKLMFQTTNQCSTLPATFSLANSPVHRPPRHSDANAPHCSAHLAAPPPNSSSGPRRPRRRRRPCRHLQWWFCVLMDKPRRKPWCLLYTCACIYTYIYIYTMIYWQTQCHKPSKNIYFSLMVCSSHGKTM